LQSAGVGTCGSRNAGENGLRAASLCGEEAAAHDLSVISGYARGVDMATHIAALESRGHTVIVLPEGIERFRIKQGAFAEAWDPARVLVVSQFSPTQPWTAGSAMTRNLTIVGLALALVVVEAGERGGTLAAGLQAMEVGRPVLALEFEDTAPGNRILLDRGAIPVRSRAELSARLSGMRETTVASQLRMF
jgi:DNA processing protein